MRGKKVSIVTDIKKKNSEIISINKELTKLGENVDFTLWTPDVENEAFPERRYLVNDADIEDLKRQEAELNKAIQGGDDMMSAFNNAPAVNQISPAVATSQTSSEKSNKLDADTSESKPETSLDFFQRLLEEAKSIAKSGLEIAEQDQRKKTLKYQRDQLLKVQLILFKSNKF